MRILFCNIGWMKNYQGISEDDPITSGGSFVDKNHEGAEQYNFLDRNGYYYGFVATKSTNGKANQIHIEKLDGITEEENEANNVLVIWVAREPMSNKRTEIVGWYKNATVYRNYQEKNIAFYNIKAKVEDCVLLPIIKRHYVIYRASEIGTGKGLGQSNIWYAQEPEAKDIVKNCVDYIFKYNDMNQNKYITNSDIESTSKELISEKEHIAKGMNLVDEGDMLNALKHYNAVLNNSPNNADVIFYKAGVLFYLNAYDKSLKLLKEVIELEKDADDAYGLMGDIYYILENIKESIDCYDKAININPNNELYYTGEINVYLYLNESEKALEICDRILCINSSSFNGYYCKANVLSNLGRYKEAIDNYERCLSMDIDQQTVEIIHYNKALLFKNLRSYENAMESIQSAINLNPSRSYYFDFKKEIQKALNKK